LQVPEPTLGDGRYIIRRELGRGTMGVVYEAEDTVLARTVAVKTIELAFTASEGTSREFEQRFFTEARVAARLAHPGIVVCHDVGKDPASGKLFIVFEYLSGRTLADRAAEGPMDWREALGVVVQVARAIQHAHEHGVIHRDLKPANIMLLDAGTSAPSAGRAEAVVKIMDFGVARLESLGQRLTRTGQSFGTPLYMSPEQALGQRSSARSDIFSLGSILCTLLLNGPWFDARSLPAIVRRVVHDDAPHLSSLRPDLPASLDAVVAMALAKREDDRYATAADMADDLEDVLAGKTATHAAAAVLSSPRRVSAEDALLAGMTLPAGAPRGIPAPDPMESLLDELQLPDATPVPGAAVAAQATQTMPARASTPVATRSGRRWLVPAGAVLGLAVLAAGALVSGRRSSLLDPARPPSGPSVSEAATTTPAPTAPTTMAGTPTTVTVPPVRPRGPGAVRPTIESPATHPSEAGERAATSSSEGAKTRIRLSIEHPFEHGRLIVWIDGVLVDETKLEAPVSRKIVAFNVREGRAEKLLEVEPGRHEVRVEVSWDQDRRNSTKVVDVAAGSTGLLEVRVGRMTKDLSLVWSRLAKN
jgi:eukaryotic-like serine/threonine-protein kinase